MIQQLCSNNRTISYLNAKLLQLQLLKLDELATPGLQCQLAPRPSAHLQLLRNGVQRSEGATCLAVQHHPQGMVCCIACQHDVNHGPFGSITVANGSFLYAH